MQLFQRDAPQLNLHGLYGLLETVGRPNHELGINTECRLPTQTGDGNGMGSSDVLWSL